MCVIIHFKPGQLIDKEALFNACSNNWHSFGLVTKVDGKLDINRHLPENGEIDTEMVYKLLQDDIDYERFLHVRHNTAGATSLENTHPFDVYYDEATGEQIVFMHNGTLYDYKSKKTITRNNAVIVEDDDEGPSDTQNFVNQVLIPYTATDFGEGAGNIHNRLYKKLCYQFWPSTGGNRGLLISAKSEPLFLGGWTTFGEDDHELIVSNTDYFKEVTRGPEKLRREAKKEEERRFREAQEKKTKGTTSSTAITVSRFRDFEVESTHDLFALNQTMSNILTDWDVWDREGMIAVGYATVDELNQIYANKKDCITLMDVVFTDYAKMADDLETLEDQIDALKDKNAKASKHIESLVRRCQELEGKTKKVDKKAA